jgi:hypothetical protein
MTVAMADEDVGCGEQSVRKFIPSMEPKLSACNVSV